MRNLAALVLTLAGAACGRAVAADANDASPGVGSSVAIAASARSSPSDAGAPAARALVLALPPALDAGTAVDPFGVARSSTRASCAALGGKHVSESDMKTSFVDGDDLLAIVNRSPTG